MDKAFLDWWELNKFKLIENEEVGLREIAYAGWLAGCNLKDGISDGIEASPAP